MPEFPTELRLSLDSKIEWTKEWLPVDIEAYKRYYLSEHPEADYQMGLNYLQELKKAFFPANEESEKIIINKFKWLDYLI